jgi:hypothetical protein
MAAMAGSDSSTTRSPRGIAVASDGSVYIADTLNDRIRRVGTDGIIALSLETGFAATVAIMGQPTRHS